MFNLTVKSVGGETIGSGESLQGESAADAFVRLFGGMLGVEGPGQWTPEGNPGRFAVVAHFAPDSARFARGLEHLLRRDLAPADSPGLKSRVFAPRGDRISG